MNQVQIKFSKYKSRWRRVFQIDLFFLFRDILCKAGLRRREEDQIQFERLHVKQNATKLGKNKPSFDIINLCLNKLKRLKHCSQLQYCQEILNI